MPCFALLAADHRLSDPHPPNRHPIPSSLLAHIRRWFFVCLLASFRGRGPQARHEEEEVGLNAFSACGGTTSFIGGGGGSPSITVGYPSGLRVPPFCAPHIRIMNADTAHHPYGGDDSGGARMLSTSSMEAGFSFVRSTGCGELSEEQRWEDEAKATSGRQYGSFSCLSLLAEECSSPYARSAAYGTATTSSSYQPQRGLSTSTSPSHFASTVGLGGGDDDDTKGLQRLVVVHPAHEEEVENCSLAAGKKQRGSFNSLLLLEAHSLSMQSVPSHGSDLCLLDQECS